MQNIKIQDYSLPGYGSRNLIDGYRGVGQDVLHLLKGSEDTPRMFLQNIHNHVPDYTASKSRPSMNSHQFKHLKSCTKYKEKVKHGRKCYVGKTELLEV
jgi:hypothetical protein